MRSYDNVIIIESVFQEEIVSFLHESGAIVGTSLTIRRTKTGFDIDNSNISLNFNSLRSVVKSIISLRDIPPITCSNLYATHITGVDTRVLAASIKHTSKILIDDGIGTPLILENPAFYLRLPIELLKMWIARLSVAVTKGEIIPFTKGIINDVTKYYSIYYKQHQSLKTERIPLLNSWQYQPNQEFTGFIGQPFVEYGFLKDHMYRALLEHLSSSCETLLYYPDPSEEWIYNQHIPNITIVQKRVSLENFLATNGGPHTLISMVSSALLNIKLANPAINAYYIKLPGQKLLRRPYYNLFEQHGNQN